MVKQLGYRSSPDRCESKYFYETIPCRFMDDEDIEFLKVLDFIADAKQGDWWVSDNILEEFMDSFDVEEKLDHIPKDHRLRQEWLYFVEKRVLEEEKFFSAVDKKASDWVEGEREEAMEAFNEREEK